MGTPTPADPQPGSQQTLVKIVPLCLQLDHKTQLRKAILEATVLPRFWKRTKRCLVCNQKTSQNIHV